MTKNEVKDIQKTYGMEVLRDPITQEAQGVYCEADRLIPELDRMNAAPASCSFEQCETYPCYVTREMIGCGYRYVIYCPKEWFDLYGWADE